MSLDKLCEQDFVKFSWTFFGGVGAGGTQYYQYGRGGLMDTNALRGTHCGLERGNMYMHRTGAFQNSGLPMTMAISVDGTTITTASLIIANGVFIDVVTAVPIDSPLIPTSFIRGINIFSLGGGFFLVSNMLMIEVIKR